MASFPSPHPLSLSLRPADRCPVGQGDGRDARRHLREHERAGHRAAKRSGEGVTGTEGARANEAPQAPPEKSAEAGKGADAAQQAKVALDEARAAEAKGDTKACEAAIERAKSQLGKAP